MHIMSYMNLLNNIYIYKCTQDTATPPSILLSILQYTTLTLQTRRGRLSQKWHCKLWEPYPFGSIGVAQRRNTIDCDECPQGMSSISAFHTWGIIMCWLFGCCVCCCINFWGCACLWLLLWLRLRLCLCLWCLSSSSSLWLLLSSLLLSLRSLLLSASATDNMQTWQVTHQLCNPIYTCFIQSDSQFACFRTSPLDFKQAHQISRI